MRIINPIKFGTDGWRGIIAEDFTFDNVRLCAQAFAEYLKESGQAEKGLVIGYDTRFASEDFARAAAEVAAGNGIHVRLSPKATPTPVISYGVTALGAGGGIVITASHNPPQWNGFKIKSEDGTSAPPDVISRIEERLAGTEKVNRLSLPEGIDRGLIEYSDLKQLYINNVKAMFDLDSLKRKRLRIVVDSMYGAGAGYFKELLSGGAIEIIELNAGRNPSFPGIKQPEPIAPNLGGLSVRVGEARADIGLATDGDADRLGVVNENGRFISQLQVLALLAFYFLEVRGERGAIIKTLTTTRMLDRLGEIYGVPVIETKVGFKYIAEAMKQNDALIGGEESGGYAFRGHLRERDAILSGLYFLDFMAKTGKRPSVLLEHLFGIVGPHHYDRLDIDFPPRKRQEITERVKNSSPEAIMGVGVAGRDSTDGFRFKMDDGSWLLIRFSGTEPLLRIYAESESPERVAGLLGAGREIAGV